MFTTLATHVEENERRIFWSLALLALGASAGYLYFLSVSVFSVVARRSAEAETRTLTADISDLEATYASLDKQIDLAMARDRGFVDVAVPQYLSVKKGETALSFRASTDPR